ncbi:MAG: hypothetical protein NWS62_04845 [Gaiellales bacterium]|nr:hypothetical protein [Gaiellales bacterium]
MERSLRILAALLMLALVVGAAFVFFRSQMLKSAPSPIIAPTVSSAAFSPNAFRPARRAATLTVGLRKADRATVVIFDTEDRQIAEAVTMQTGRKIRASWGGRLPSGTLAPDGPYRFAIRLLRQNRTIRIPDPIILDATAPVVASDAKPGQRIAPGLEGSMGAYSFTLSADEPVKFRLDVRQIQPNGADRLVRRETDLQFARRKEMHWSADAGNLPLDKVGTPVGPGSYIVGWKAEDRAGNLVVAPEVVKPNELAPAQVVGVETVALTQSLVPQTLLAEVTLVRQRPGRSFPGTVVARAKGAPGAVKLPGAPAGFYAIRISGGGWRAWTPNAIPGGAPVLVMEPLYSWQATNPTDADLSGFPDVSPAPLALDRPLGAGSEPLLAALGHVAAEARSATRRRVGAITDMAIEDRGVPASTRVLIIARAPVWTEGLYRALRRFHARGGSVVVLDAISMSRKASRSGGAIAIDGQQSADVEALDPIWTISGAVTAFPRAAR